MDDYDVESAYAPDPDGVTWRSSPLPQRKPPGKLQHSTPHAGTQVARVRAAAESATLAAMGHLEARYGREELQRLQPNVAEKLAANPNLVPP